MSNAMSTIPSHVQTEDKAFVRDTYSKALINTDRDALERHRAMRRRASETVQLRTELTMVTRVCEKIELRLTEMTAVLQQVVLALQR